MLGLNISLWLSTTDAASSGSSWNTSDAGALWTLSADNHVALRTSASPGAWESLRGTTGHGSGKWYFELVALDTVAGSDNWMLGIANATALVTTYLGNSNYGMGLRNISSHLAGFTAGTGALVSAKTTTANAVYQFAVDADAGKVWYGEANTWRSSGNPAAGTLPAYTYTPGTVGAVYPAIAATDPLSRWAMRTSSGAFSYAPPSGFLAWG